MTNTYQQIYYHNLFGWTDQQPYAYAFNHFAADQSGLLKSVSFYTTDDDVGYTVNVYEQFQGGVLGNLAATISGTEAFEGLHTIDLPSLVSLTQGQNFYIELRTSNGQQANDGDISWQRLLDFGNSTGTAMTTSQSGQSFYSANGTNWTDLYSTDSTHSQNFAIDALTISNTAMVWAAGTGSLVGSGSWSVAGNWQNGTAPNGPTTGAVFNGATTAAVTIMLNAPQTIGTLVLGNSASNNAGYTLYGSGSNTLTLDNSGSGATITVTGGTHVIDAPTILADNLLVTGYPLAGGSTNSWTLTFAGNASITDNGAGYSLTMSGTGGTLVLSGSDSFTGGTIVEAGTLVATDPEALPDGGNLTVGADGSLFFGLTAAGTPPMASSGPMVVPVPEPSTFALLAMLLCALPLHRAGRRLSRGRGARAQPTSTGYLTFSSSTRKWSFAPLGITPGTPSSP